MQSSAIPALLTAAFANAGQKNAIGVASNPPFATLADGFPPITMTPLASGGVPPDGKDFNGILNWITQLLLWQNSGGLFPFSATLSTAIGGYPKGMVLQSNDKASAYVSLIENNTYDPNTPANIGPYWAPWAGAAGDNGQYAIDTGAVNAIVVAMNPPITAYAKGAVCSFKVLVTNTGATTVNAGGGAVALVRNDGTAVQAGDLVAGAVYTAVYDAVLGKFMLLSSALSQLSTLALSTVAAGNLTGYRNILHNPTFMINQRGYVSGTNTSASNQYCHDRWRIPTSGQNVTFVANGNGATVTCPAGGYEQVVGGEDIVGGTYVLNWTGTATATINGTSIGKGGTISLPAGTNATVRFTGGTIFQPQLEPGTLPTPFENRPASIDLVICRRFWRACGRSFSGQGETAATVILAGTIDPAMRTTPTISASTYAPTLRDAATDRSPGTTGWTVLWVTTTAIGVLLTGGVGNSATRPCTSEVDFIYASSDY